MPIDPAALAAIADAVDGAPENHALRAHYAELLLDAGQSAAAFEQCTIVLGAVPDQLEALRVGARAARAVGDDTRAAAWQRLADALGADAPEASASALPPTSEPPGEAPPPVAIPADVDDGSGTDWDGWLQDLVEPAHQREPVTLADVGGLDEVKRRLQSAFLAPLQNPTLRRAAYGKSLRGGMLLWGPPGCGKTFVARALAGELGAAFVHIGLHDVLDMYFGNSEQRLHGIFEEARRNAPCVLFFDQVDALGQRRSNLAHSMGRNVVAQFLAELDGVDTQNEGLFILGATNQPWDVDPALRRPGRFDRSVLVVPPDAGARKRIVDVHLRERPVGELDLDRIAARTEGYSGADLARVCETATELALEASIVSGDIRPIEMSDMLAAISDTRPSTADWFETAKSYAKYANQSGELDELAAYLRRRR